MKSPIDRTPNPTFIYDVPTKGTERFRPTGDKGLYGGYHTGDGSKDPGPGNTVRKPSRHHRYTFGGLKPQSFRRAI